MSYIKHFAEESPQYQTFRPTYPAALFQYLYSYVKEFDTAWDVGTGNGQAAEELAKKFNHVIATDLLEEQLKVAIKADNIIYQCSRAEKTTIFPHSIDLITIAQALHWFHLDDFYREVIRVAKKSAVIAAWCYSLGHMDPAIDPIITKLYFDLGDQYWPKERYYIDEGYQTMPFPFKKWPTPEFTIEKLFNFNDFMGYLNTWSAVKEYQKHHHKNPIELYKSDFEKAWGNLETPHTMHWPIHLLIAYVNE